ncbi:MAG TPA: CvpA family protein [Candidatus Acidoferrum sp.]|nr:CvpA family protein [Candidatus Acidoferrum sp.]
MKFPEISLSWVDFATAIVLLIGFLCGRKRGLSEELLDTVQWLAIIALGALFYRPLGNFMAHQPWLSQLTYYVLAYILIALLIKITFVFIKKSFGEKLIESDIFGRVEFYFGMLAGMLRWTCMYVFALSLLHAPHYSEAELAQRQKEVEYNFGSDFFPSIDKIQVEVYEVSVTGRNLQKYLPQVLISPTSGDATPIRHENSMGKRREREVDSIFQRR